MFNTSSASSNHKEIGLYCNMHIFKECCFLHINIRKSKASTSHCPWKQRFQFSPSKKLKTYFTLSYQLEPVKHGYLNVHTSLQYTLLDSSFSVHQYYSQSLITGNYSYQNHCFLSRWHKCWESRKEDTIEYEKIPRHSMQYCETKVPNCRQL